MWHWLGVALKWLNEHLAADHAIKFPALKQDVEILPGADAGSYSVAFR